MILDPLADMLTRIRNAQRMGHETVTILGSNQVGRVLAVLAEERFVEKFERVNVQGRGGYDFRVVLRYAKDGRPLIRECKRVSKGGRRVYARVDELKRVRAGLGITVVSTPKGVMSDSAARRARVGGEVLMAIS
jgi:small subunit ribosomal protein S8